MCSPCSSPSGESKGFGDYGQEQNVLKPRTMSLAHPQPEKPSQVQICTASQNLQEEEDAWGANWGEQGALSIEGRRQPRGDVKSKAPRGVRITQRTTVQMLHMAVMRADPGVVTHQPWD